MFSRLLHRLKPQRDPIGASLEHLVGAAHLYGSPDTTRIAREFPAQARATIDAAERVLRHEFNVLGSGQFVPVDRERPRRNGYTPIDWSLDPVRNLRFPRGFPHTEWKLYEMRPGNADVKYPWELARCQHWPVLGQAFALTGEDRFAREIADELDDFVEANPIGIGINFTCTMDVAIRAVNWALAFDLVRSSTALDIAFWRRGYRALYDTGVFTRNNLENTYEVTSNHFLSNVVGLWFLGAVFADLPEGREWLAFARDALEREIVVQVLPDGADYESSVPYHRLVTELFLASLHLGDVRNAPLSAAFRARVRDMVAFLAAVTRPDGLMPQIGDADDGRLHVLGGYGTVSPQDARHLFGPAGVIFREPAWTNLAGEDGGWESSWWGLEPVMRSGAPSAAGSRLFPDAGLAVMRAGEAHYLLASNGVVGTKGFGNHKHNDLLSFEYHSDGVPLVVDPGSYVYTSDFAARNRFRSTATHNTLEIDGREQNDLRPEWIFRLFETSHAEHVAFADMQEYVEYTGRHHGYERFDQAVTHERTFRLSKSDGALTILDRLKGRGEHDLRWHFHLAPAVKAESLSSSAVLLTSKARHWYLRMPGGVAVEIVAAEYSPSYGVACPCMAVNASARVAFDGVAAQCFEFSIRDERA